MLVSESLLIAVFCVTVVFIVLISLFAIIRIFSLILNVLSKNKQDSHDMTQVDVQQENVEEVFSSGKLILKNVDEPTAAMLMAIVSDESGIPLSELCFKSMRLVE